MISTFLEALKSFLKICVPLLGTYVLFLAERSLSIVDPSYKNGVKRPKIYVSFDEKISMKNKVRSPTLGNGRRGSPKNKFIKK